MTPYKLENPHNGPSALLSFKEKLVPIKSGSLNSYLWQSVKLKIQENQNQGNSISGIYQSVNLKIQEAQNPASQKSRRFQIVEVYFPVSLKSGKLKIQEAQNLGNPKSCKPKFGRPNVGETQNHRNSKPLN